MEPILDTRAYTRAGRTANADGLTEGAFTSQPLTAQEPKRMLKRASFNQRATALGLNERTLRKYVLGESPIPRVVTLALHGVIERTQPT